MGIIYKISIYFYALSQIALQLDIIFAILREVVVLPTYMRGGFFLKKNILVGQSGGPTAVINASLYGIIKEAAAHSEQIRSVYGMINGIEGFLSGHIMDLSKELSDEDLELLRLTPAAYLGSCRYKLPENLDASVYTLLFEKFEQLNIGAVFYIGGNDSMDTADKLSRWAAHNNKEISFIGVPKTIDNDLPVTDHTPGYGSAARYVASTVREIVLDASVYQQPAVTIVELMGRHAGWVTAASSLARKFPGDNPLLIYMPEAPFEMEEFFSDLENALKQSTAVVVCVSEGIRDASGKFICEYSNEAQLDTFGHKMLTGCGKLLESYVRNRFGVKVRSVELNVNQRCSSLLSSLTDINEADLAGRTAVKCALEGVTGKMITFKRADGEEYSLEYGLVDVCDVCNKEKPFPTEWITGNNNDISPEFANYALPLMRGVPEHVFEDGVPKYLYRK
jgi:hypothetical protein